MHQDDFDYVAMGKVVRKARLQHGMTQTDLSNVSGINISFVGHIERAERVPSLRTLHALIKALGLTPNDLLLEPMDSSNTLPDALSNTPDEAKTPLDCFSTHPSVKQRRGRHTKPLT